jgi:hypothetical protein
MRLLIAQPRQLEIDPPEEEPSLRGNYSTVDDPTSHAAVILIGGAHSESGKVIGMSAAQLWELLRTHAWHTGKVAGTRDYCSARACSAARVTSICATAALYSRRSTRGESPSTWRTSPGTRGPPLTGGPTVAAST